MRNVWMLSLLVLIDGTVRAFAATPSHSGSAELQNFQTARPRAPQSVEPAAKFSALAVVDFLSVFGGVPAASSVSILPQSESERQTWEPQLSAWRKDQADLLARLKSLVPGQAGALSADTKGALVALKGQIEGWQNRDKAAAYGGQIFSKEARDAAQDSAEFLVAYAEAFARITDPALSRSEKEHLALEAARKAHPESELSRPSARELEALSPFHREQAKNLLGLRDSLRNSGGMEEFAAQLRKDTRPARRIESLAHR